MNDKLRSGVRTLTDPFVGAIRCVGVATAASGHRHRAVQHPVVTCCGLWRMHYLFVCANALNEFPIPQQLKAA
jgi:hypothetical protein